MTRTYTKVRIRKGFFLFVFIFKNTCHYLFYLPMPFCVPFLPVPFFPVPLLLYIFTGTFLPVPFLPPTLFNKPSYEMLSESS